MRQKHNQIIYSNSSKISFHSNLAKPIQVETFRFAHILANDFVHMTFNIIYTQICVWNLLKSNWDSAA